MPRDAITWDRLPLFASDEAIGEAVLGRDRKCEFHGLATLHERDGMPKISPVWGGRYVPAVKSFLDAQFGLSAAVPLAPNGVEGNFHEHTKRAPKGTGPQVATTEDRPAGPVLVR
jgi:hypothetical protein